MTCNLLYFVLAISHQACPSSSGCATCKQEHYDNDVKGKLHEVAVEMTLLQSLGACFGAVVYPQFHRSLPLNLVFGNMCVAHRITANVQDL
jgi:hypothetical protein